MTGSARTPESGNRLGDESSPYLRQHRDNPVHWWPWGPAAFAAAKAADRPILLSIGYAACHWCHVMAAESFEDATIAAVMNEQFVNIKVDREEHPDIDHVYQAALALLGQPGGWPLTMFLTPDGTPFWGGTYFPPTPSRGRPGLPEVLRMVALAYWSHPGLIRDAAVALRAGLDTITAGVPTEGITPAMLDRAAAAMFAEVDPIRGGTWGAPKFPNCPAFSFLWQTWRRTRNDRTRRAVIATLDAMCLGGIYDHLAGGFARYATDEAWLVPHFEKMLYDNALLIDLLTDVWRETRSPLYAARVEETIGWLVAEMRIGAGEEGARNDGDAGDPGAEDRGTEDRDAEDRGTEDRNAVDRRDAAFAASLDADSEHEEGRYYVWTAADIDAVLGPDADAFKAAYGVTAEGTWEGRCILHRPHRPGAAPAASDSTCVGVQEVARETALVTARQRLAAVRATRVRPGRDTKVLADWNGLAIGAIARAALVIDRPEWGAIARSAWRFVTTRMQHPDTGRLRHVWCAGESRHPATLDDYAALADAGLALHTLVPSGSDPDPLTTVRRWIDTLDHHYWDEHGHGYFLTADDATDAGPVLVRAKSAHDGATPSGNALMIRVLTRLAVLTGEHRYQERAAAIIHAFGGEIASTPWPMASFMATVETFLASPLSADPASAYTCRDGVCASPPSPPVS